QGPYAPDSQAIQKSRHRPHPPISLHRATNSTTKLTPIQHDLDIAQRPQKVTILIRQRHRTTTRDRLRMRLIRPRSARIEHSFRLLRQVDSRHARLHQPALIEDPTLTETDMHMVVVTTLSRARRILLLPATTPL